MWGVSNLSAYALGTLLIILLPGPSSLYTLSVAARWGVRTGYRAALGVFLGETLLITLTAAGLASLLRANDLVFSIIKYAGAGFLAWVAIGMLRGALEMWRDRRMVTAAGGREEKGTGERPFRRALLITLFNPKALLFFISFFVQFVDPSYPHPAVSFGLLAVIYLVISGCYLTLLVLGGTYLAERFRRRKRLSAGLTTAAGALFLGFAAKLATTST
ncbi:leucine efflux protein LeuE [Streptomyces alkaliphilus]|uniref:leucine efflux protein LeuE n=1 Tax=Streptomyces alkaliphilus TaxID=1472722 RepID=UPI00118018D7|nr:leucine efflux protein LeuE [Streptomyces alkaliphilus]MQS06208.1 leucine efflux protein LeuE [Streptomyces alkaliphilus]